MRYCRLTLSLVVLVGGGALVWFRPGETTWAFVSGAALLVLRYWFDGGHARVGTDADTGNEGSGAAGGRSSLYSGAD